MAKNDGGPAFPTFTGESRDNAAGMSLRDYFAAQALEGWLAFGTPQRILEHASAETVKSTDEMIVARCYQLADAMIAERAK